MLVANVVSCITKCIVLVLKLYHDNEDGWVAKFLFSDVCIPLGTSCKIDEDAQV